MLKIFFEKMLQKNLTFSFRLFIRKIHFTSLSFYVMFIYDYAIFYGCFLSVENGTKKQ